MVSLEYSKDKYCRLIYSLRIENRTKQKHFSLSKREFPELYLINKEIEERSNFIDKIYIKYHILKELDINWSNIFKKIKKTKEKKRKEFIEIFKKESNDKGDFKKIMPIEKLYITDNKIIKSIIKYYLKNPLFEIMKEQQPSKKKLKYIELYNSYARAINHIINCDKEIKNILQLKKEYKNYESGTLDSLDMKIHDISIRLRMVLDEFKDSNNWTKKPA